MRVDAMKRATQLQPWMTILYHGYLPAAALDVGCGETDFIIREGATLGIDVTASGQLDGESVVLEVAPMSLQDYMDMNRTLPDGVSAHEDPAEPGEESSLSDAHAYSCLGVGSHGLVKWKPCSE